MEEATKNVVYINYCDEINLAKTKAFMGGISDIVSKQHPDVLYILFASSGGLIDSGIALYNFLRALPVEIIMHNIGNIDSIANVVFLAAETRYTSVHSSFLFHGINWNFGPNASVNKNQINEIMSYFKLSESKIAGIITERTKLTTEEVMALSSHGESKNAEYALAKGVVSEIKDPRIPKGANILSFNIN